MIEISGNFWELAPKYNVLVCTTNKIVKNNGRLVMGAGIAKDFRDRYFDIDKIWGDRTRQFPAQGVYAYQTLDGKLLLSFPTKFDWNKDSNLLLIEKSTQSLIAIVNCFNLDKILMTRPGCGNGNLEWNKVRDIISIYLDDRFTIVNSGAY